MPFGGGAAKSNLVGFNAGGLSARTTTVGGKENVDITSSALREGLVGNIAETFPEQAKLLKDLRTRVTPGIGDLTRARLSEIESSRQRTVGDLQQNLARRRVLGSSFGQDALTRANREFAQEAEKARSESFLQELELNTYLTQAEYEARRGQFQTSLDELNLQAEVATQLSTEATAQLNENYRMQQQMQMQTLGGIGQLFGLMLGGF